MSTRSDNSGGAHESNRGCLPQPNTQIVLSVARRDTAHMSLRITSGRSSPSFLEVVAAHRLEKSIRDAFSYVLSVRDPYVIAPDARPGYLLVLTLDTCFRISSET